MTSRDPWYFMELPTPPRDASNAQVIEHAGVAAYIDFETRRHAELDYDPEAMALPARAVRAMRAYVDRWHGDEVREAARAAIEAYTSEYDV